GSVRATDFPPEFIQMYNLSIQHEVAPNWLVELGYVGNRPSRVAVITQINDAYPALPADTSPVQSRRRISTVLGNLPYLAPQGFSNYNATTLSLEKRFSQGNNTSVQDPFNLKREYGPLEFDVINRVSVGYVYDLPFGKGRHFLTNPNRAAEYLLGGWQVNGILTLQGGFPITPTLSYSLGKTNTNSRPNAIGHPTKTSRRT